MRLLRSDSRNAGMLPGCAVRSAQNLGGFRVPHNHPPLRVVNYRPADLNSEVGEDTARGGDVACLDNLLLRVDEVRRALALCADLYQAVVFACGIKHGFAFRHVPADWLLAVHLGAGFNRSDRVKRVPMIWRTDEHDVEVLRRLVPATQPRSGNYTFA
jgi:hypothetical protein